MLWCQVCLSAMVPPHVTPGAAAADAGSKARRVETISFLADQVPKPRATPTTAVTNNTATTDAGPRGDGAVAAPDSAAAPDPVPGVAKSAAARAQEECEALVATLLGTRPVWSFAMMARYTHNHPYQLQALATLTYKFKTGACGSTHTVQRCGWTATLCDLEA